VEWRVWRIFDQLGDHAIVILEVIEAECNQGVRPLAVAGSPWQYSG
jgi:hypothetical protein